VFYLFGAVAPHVKHMMNYSGKSEARTFKQVCLISKTSLPISLKNQFVYQPHRFLERCT